MQENLVKLNLNKEHVKLVRELTDDFIKRLGAN